MYASKPLGLKARISDSILRFTLNHFGEYRSPLGIYNAWVTSDAIEQQLQVRTPDLISYAIEQASAFFRSSREELIMCKEIEDCFSK